MIDHSSPAPGEDLTTPVPSEDLIFLVNGHRDREQFRISRLATVKNIIALIEEAGGDVASLDNILDFGCGCGRVLAGWEPYLRPRMQLSGVDVNTALVDFCQQHIPFAAVQVTDYLPPLAQYRDGQFDLVYAASVFTHLDAPAARAWAAEFRRIIRPGGILMMSFHGAYYVPRLKRRSRWAWLRLGLTGHVVLRLKPDQPTWSGSNDYAAFMTSRFADSLFTGFERLKTFPGATRGPNPFASYQDISIYRRNG